MRSESSYKFGDETAHGTVKGDNKGGTANPDMEKELKRMRDENQRLLKELKTKNKGSQKSCCCCTIF